MDVNQRFFYMNNHKSFDIPFLNLFTKKLKVSVRQIGEMPIISIL